MLPVMDPFLELPDLPQNTVMLNYLRGQASPPADPNDWLLGSWQLHAHPDLFRVLRDLAPVRQLTAAYGFRCWLAMVWLPSWTWAQTGWRCGSMTCRPMRRPTTAILLWSGSDHTAPR
jgi:hypothetical protein